MRRTKYTIEEVTRYIAEKNGTCLSQDYKNNKAKIAIRCNTCMHSWLTTFKDVKVNGNWCSNCAQNKRLSISDAQAFAFERNGICMSNEYRNNKTPLKWFCNVCDCIWFARFDRIKSGTWCPNCRKSHGEKKIATYLKRKKIEFKPEYILKDANNKRFDFYLPEYNLAIEFDGKQHFELCGRYCRNKEDLIRNHQYDIDKVHYCIQKDIRILRISYSARNVEAILQESLDMNAQLMLDSETKYEYILDTIDRKKITVVIATGVGKQESSQL